MKKDPSAQSLSGMMAYIMERGVCFRTRTIYIHGEIDDNQATRVTAALDVLSLKPGPVTIKLFSCGGDVAGGMVIYDAIRTSGLHVTIIGSGRVFSMASVILQAGTVRLLTPEARVMIHDPHLTHEAEQSRVRDLKATTAELAEVAERCYVRLRERSGRTMTEIRRYCGRETFLSAKRAVDLGFADGLMEYKEPKRDESEQRIEELDPQEVANHAEARD